MVRTILLKEEEKAMEYIEEKEKFINIVNNHRISITWDRAKGVKGGKRDGYYYKIIFDTRHFNYWEGSAHEPINEDNTNSKIVNFLHCLVTDYFTHKSDIADIEDTKERQKLWKAIEEEREKLNKIFTQEELEQLSECYQNY